MAFLLVNATICVCVLVLWIPLCKMLWLVLLVGNEILRLVLCKRLVSLHIMGL